MLALTHSSILRAESTDVVRPEAYSVVPCTIGMGKVVGTSWGELGLGRSIQDERVFLQQRDILATQAKYGAGIVNGRWRG